MDDAANPPITKSLVLERDSSPENLLSRCGCRGTRTMNPLWISAPSGIVDMSLSGSWNTGISAGIAAEFTSKATVEDW